jgi:hypothetical protein
LNSSTHCFILLLALAMDAAAVVQASAAAEPAAPQVRLLVPAYFYPAGRGRDEWDKLLTAASEVPIVAIVNPASGPGRRVDPNYSAIFERAANAKNLTLIGYVTTSYAKRPVADVNAEVDRWLEFYPGINGIFFDEQASGHEHVDYQAELYEHVRTARKLKLVITNPGTTCAEGFVSRPAADAVCLFEGPRPFDAAPLPEWVARYKPDRIAALSYQIESSSDMQKLIAAAGERKIGYCYVTDAGGNNPWNRLPKYWEEEVKAVNRSSAASR